MKNPRACPDCRSRGEDSTGDHLYIAKSGEAELNFWICRKCGYREHRKTGVELSSWPIGIREPSVSGDTKSSSSSSSLSIEEIKDLPSVADRGIAESIRKKYGVVSELNTSTGLPEKHYYPVTRSKKIVGYKVRVIKSKDFYKTKGIGNPIDLFGVNALTQTRRVVITEGEEDAMAAKQMLKGYSWGAISLPDGNGGMSSVKESLKYLESIDTLVFCPDQDKAGEESVKKIVKLLPSIKIALPMSEKDANEMLLRGKAEEFRDCITQSEKYKPPALVRVSDVIDEAIKLPEWGRLYPWPTLNAKTYGMRDGEGMYVGAGVKIGKSEFINELVLSRINANDGDIPAVIKFEERPAMTVKKLAGKMDKTFYHKPDVSFDPKDLEKTAMSLDGKLMMYRSFSSAKWDDVKMYIRYAVSEGAKTVIIDPATKLTNHLSSSETETELRKISDELACMAQDLGFFYIVTCHLKTPHMGVPHERGGKVMSAQFRGSRAMMENCYYLLGIERNKDPQLSKTEINTSTFVLLEDRAFGKTAEFPVFYDSDTGSYLEAI